MKTKRFFKNMNRSCFDWTLTGKRGWCQIDTGSDAWYYGNWCNPRRLTIISYCEGDITVQICDNIAEFKQRIDYMRKWHLSNDGKFGIDTLLNKKTDKFMADYGINCEYEKNELYNGIGA